MLEQLVKDLPEDSKQRLRDIFADIEKKTSKKK